MTGVRDYAVGPDAARWLPDTDTIEPVIPAPRIQIVIDQAALQRFVDQISAAMNRIVQALRPVADGMLSRFRNLASIARSVAEHERADYRAHQLGAAAERARTNRQIVTLYDDGIGVRW